MFSANFAVKSFARAATATAFNR